VRASLLALALTLLVAAPAAAMPSIHAHRGGSVVDGVPRFPENTMPAFEHSAARGWVLELDVELTADGVPVVIHDATLDRTTVCTGPVRAKTLAQLRACPTDVLGSPGSGMPSAPTEQRVPIPRLAEVLDLARRTGARLNIEIKNIPTEPESFDATDGFATAVVEAVKAAELPSSQLIMQSFWPPNLEVSERLMPAVPTSLLTLAPMNDGAPAFAAARGFEWVSPAAPPSRQAVSGAHEAGRQVVPYTPNDPDAVKQSAAASVDAIITDDPTMARRALLEVEPPAPPIPPPPSREECRDARASRSTPTIEAYASGKGPRVFAMQFKQELRHVESYDSFRTKIECAIRERVVPNLAKRRPNVVAFNEDVGLMTIATGTRGAAARDLIAARVAPGCEAQGAPCTTLAALGVVTASYGKEVALYRKRFGDMQPVSSAFVAATDTFARGWMQLFSDMARRYGVYILGSNNQAPFRESTDPTEVATLADPDLPEPPRSVFVATDDAVYNEVFLWAPKAVREDGPRPLLNMVASNKKVPLTPIEEQIQLTPGPSTGPDAIENLRPYRIPGTEARVGFATSLPAFVYGDASADPCADTAKTYMRCLDHLGTNLVMQDEANPGRWAADAGSGMWQPEEWLTSTWRAVTDPTVGFDYNVTPHMVGNLADLAFDGQTAITQRGLRSRRGCNYVGNPGVKREFVAIAPWVTPDAPRDELRATGAKLAPGSGDALENDYVETAIAADLPFPPKPRRKGCER
jgi:glycerophosphoryl diester phosphodiesterase